MLFHQAGIFVVLKLCVSCGVFKPVEPKEVPALIWPSITLGTLRAGNLILNSASLVYLSLPMNQCIRCTSPVLVMVFSYCIERKVFTWQAYCGGILTVVGAVLSVKGNPEYNHTGVLLCVSATVFVALQSNVSALILENDPGMLVHLTMYNSLIAAYWCIPLVLLFELDGFHLYAATHSIKTCLVYLTVGLALAVSYAMTTNKFVSVAGSTLSSMISNFKLVLIIVASFFVFHDILTEMNILGVAVTVVGFVFYSRNSLAPKKKRDVHEVEDEFSFKKANMSDGNSPDIDNSSESDGDNEESSLLSMHRSRLTGRKARRRKRRVERTRREIMSICMLEAFLTLWLLGLVCIMFYIPKTHREYVAHMKPLYGGKAVEYIIPVRGTRQADRLASSESIHKPLDKQVAPLRFHLSHSPEMKNASAMASPRRQKLPAARPAMSKYEKTNGQHTPRKAQKRKKRTKGINAKNASYPVRKKKKQAINSLRHSKEDFEKLLASADASTEQTMLNQAHKDGLDVGKF